MGANKKIMIIGAGAGQVPLILASKNRGLFTLVVSPDGPYTGIKEADKWIPLDIYDKEAILSVARDEKIDYVLSDQSDFAVPTVAYVAENMGLAGNSIRTAEVYSDKNIQRQFCVENHFPVPQSVALKEESDVKAVPFPFPWVIKPADSQGSRGIRKVNSLSEALDAYNSALVYSKKKIVVAEEFFEGKEVVSEGFIVDGKYFNIAFADREYFNLEGRFIPSKTIFPSGINNITRDKLIKNDEAFVLCSGAKFGIMHSEYLVGPSGDYRLVETALRGGGVYISSHLIPICTGIDLTRVLLDYLLLGSRSVLDYLHNGRKQDIEYAAYVCFYLENGIVKRVDGVEKVKKMPHVVLLEIDNIVPGYVYCGLNHKGNRLGPFLLRAGSKKELLYVIECIKNVFAVEVDGYDGNAVMWE